MSVLIKGINMPKNEPLLLNIYPDGRVACNLDSYSAQAIAIQPHGRLIDADALARKHRTIAYKKGGSSYSFHMTAKAWVDDAPTVIPASKETDNEKD